MPDEMNTQTVDAAQENGTEQATEKTAEQQLLEATEQIQSLMNEVAKLKKASDKNAEEAANWKRQYKSTLSAQEQASQEKAEKEAEREAYIAQILRENQINKVTRQYLGLGWSEELATKAATATADNDMDALLTIQKEAQNALIAENRPNGSSPDLRSTLAQQDRLRRSSSRTWDSSSAQNSRMSRRTPTHSLSAKHNNQFLMRGK